MIVVAVVAGCWLLGLAVAWVFCRIADQADQAMEDMP